MIDHFSDRLSPSSRSGGLRMADSWIWSGSVIKGDDGRFHMFADRIPSALPFHPHWLTNSEIIRASADTPEGPYTFEEVVLPPRGRQHWDGLCTHAPTILKHRDSYVLFYWGSTYSFPMPTSNNPLIPSDTDKIDEAKMVRRIGIATAPSVHGPWTRRNAPILAPRPDSWDADWVANPAPYIDPNGRVLLIYKSDDVLSAGRTGPNLRRLGVAVAERIEGPYVRAKDDPIFDFGTDDVEDPCIWYESDRFHLVMKDLTGGVSGERYGGISATSLNGIDWTVSAPPQAYSRTVRWDDGTESVLGNREQPRILMQNGKPTHLFNAAAHPAPFNEAKVGRDTLWSMVTPLKR